MQQNRVFVYISKIISIVFVSLWVISCSSDGNETTEEIVDDNVSLDIFLSVEQHPDNTLMAIASVTTLNPASVSIRYYSDSTPVRETSYSLFATENQITLAGMRSNTIYTIQAILKYESGITEESETLSYTTGTLPITPPQTNITQVATSESLGGITFFGSISDASQNIPAVLWGVDEAGEVVWYFTDGSNAAGVTPFLRHLEGNKFLVNMGGKIFEMSFLGDVIYEYSISGFHHDVIVLPNGHQMGLFRETVIVDGKSLQADIIREFDNTNNLVWEWHSAEHLDTTRFPGPLSQSQNNGVYDWSHSNAIYYIEENDSVLMSLRSQSWVINIDRQTSEVNWILGNDEQTNAAFSANFFNLQTGSWMSSQHASTLTENGDILIYDNRSETNGQANNSRAVRFNIDTNEFTANQVWEFIAPKYTQSFGDVDELSNGNILVTAGGPGSSEEAYISEVTSDNRSEVVWEMTISSPVYRSERISWNDLL